LTGVVRGSLLLWPRTINRRMPAGPMPSLIIADVMVSPNRVNAFMR
jgi:hypothetical protein